MAKHTFRIPQDFGSIFGSFSACMKEIICRALFSQNSQRPQTILRQKPTNCLSLFEHFIGLAY